MPQNECAFMLSFTRDPDQSIIAASSNCRSLRTC